MALNRFHSHAVMLLNTRKHIQVGHQDSLTQQSSTSEVTTIWHYISFIIIIIITIQKVYLKRTVQDIAQLEVNKVKHNAMCSSRHIR